MKITAIETFQLNVNAPPPKDKYYPYNSYVGVRIKTDEGLEGLG